MKVQEANLQQKPQKSSTCGKKALRTCAFWRQQTKRGQFAPPARLALLVIGGYHPCVCYSYLDTDARTATASVIRDAELRWRPGQERASGNTDHGLVHGA